MSGTTQAAAHVATASRFGSLIRWTVSLHLAVLLAQLATALAFAAGFVGAGVPHLRNAWIAGGCGILQAVLIMSRRWPGASVAFRSMAVAVAIGEAVQIYLGLRGGLAWHVTLAMLIWAFGIALFIRVWTPGWTQPRGE
jgi:hypothetical protein